MVRGVEIEAEEMIHAGPRKGLGQVMTTPAMILVRSDMS